MAKTSYRHVSSGLIFRSIKGSVTDTIAVVSFFDQYRAQLPPIKITVPNLLLTKSQIKVSRYIHFLNISLKTFGKISYS